MVAFVQPRDRAIPGPNLPDSRRVPPVELSAQRRNLGVALVRGPADGLAQPGDVLLQPIDLVAMPGLEPLDFVVAPLKPEAVTVELVLQVLDRAGLIFRRPHLRLQAGVLRA